MFAASVCLLLLTVVVNNFAAEQVALTYTNFAEWMKEYKTSYASNEELMHRYETWSQNVKAINAHNAGHHKWTRGLNAFTALSFDEFNDLHLMAPQDCSATAHNSQPQPQMRKNSDFIADAPPPDERDWRRERIISEVKNQGSCGSCWSFSTTGCLESHVALATGQLVLFSEQNLVDCAGNFNNFGCNGGLPSQAFEYIRYNGGIDTEFSYPYTAGHVTPSGMCNYTFHAGATAGFVSDVYNVTQYNETDIEDKVGKYGPVSICYEVVDGFSSYSGGVYSSTTCGNTSSTVNHAVLAVGYGEYNDLTDGRTPFWIVKNSWGWNWGVDGYFLIERGENMCGLASCASFPIVES